MVYVFGIDIPLMELILVYSFLALYVLLLVFWELKKLSRLVKIEKGDIQLIESQESSAINDYIKLALQSGYSKSEIRGKLMEQGWDKKKINQLLMKL